MGEYDRSIAAAKRLIAKKGQVCTWRKTGVVTPDDPDRPWLGGEPSTTVFNPSIVFVPATDGGSSFGLSKFKDTSISFSTFGLMAPQDFIPDATDEVLRDGQALTIISIDTLRPAEDVVLHVLSIV